MTVVDHLKALGFTNSEKVGEAKGRTIVRILTAKGWTYERFATIEEVDAWAAGKSPA